MTRKLIPSSIAAQVLFNSDRTCCVCREKDKSVQIHHIDGNNADFNISNLAVLCLDCHTNTQISGGFHRKLDAEQIILYRDDWISIVAQNRAKALILNKDSSKKNKEELELLTTKLEIYRTRKQYVVLASYYNHLGNKELRDKYIKLALKQNLGSDAEIFLRDMQGRIELVNPKIIKQEINRKIKHKDWSRLGRLYINLRDYKNAIKYYFKSISQSLEEKSIFSAAFYLKELAEEKLSNFLFLEAYGEFAKKNDIWWQVRCLQELGWHKELKDLLLSKKREIEKSNDSMLKSLVYQVTGQKKELLRIEKEIAKGMSYAKN